MHADQDKQGLVQGMITGMRGLCNGLGPAMFGIIFSMFHVNLNETGKDDDGGDSGMGSGANQTLAGKGEKEVWSTVTSEIVPGPPFVFGALLVILALMVCAFIPSDIVLLDISSDSEPSGTSTIAARKVISKETNMRKKRRSRKSDVEDEEDEFELDFRSSEYTVPLIHSSFSSRSSNL